MWPWRLPSSCSRTMWSKAPRSLGYRADTVGNAASSESSSARRCAMGMRTSRCRGASSGWKPSASLKSRRFSPKAASTAHLSLRASTRPASPWRWASCASVTRALARSTASSDSLTLTSLAVVDSSSPARATFASPTVVRSPSLARCASAASASAASSSAWSLARRPSTTSPIQETIAAWCSCLSPMAVPRQPGTAAASMARQLSGKSAACWMASTTPTIRGSCRTLFCGCISSAACTCALRLAVFEWAGILPAGQRELQRWPEHDVDDAARARPSA
mmetsp:Transcript_521/g.1405  ORF Transcript_521/g.1405 Transcript_521/m.1405 type:complete len:277 (+) Transcript_521:606-1436(+)